jgi:hypothetical protein
MIYAYKKINQWTALYRIQTTKQASTATHVLKGNQSKPSRWVQLIFLNFRQYCLTARKADCLALLTLPISRVGCIYSRTPSAFWTHSTVDWSKWLESSPGRFGPRERAPRILHISGTEDEVSEHTVIILGKWTATNGDYVISPWLNVIYLVTDNIPRGSYRRADSTHTRPISQGHRCGETALNATLRWQLLTGSTTQHSLRRQLFVTISLMTPTLWRRDLTAAYRSVEVSPQGIQSHLHLVRDSLHLMLAVHEATSAKCSDFTSKH